MLKKGFVVSVFSLGLMVVRAGMVWGQDYPNKPIRLLTSETGSSTDLASRLVAPAISELLGQQVIVDNRPGNISTERAVRATPDGYTVAVFGSRSWVEPLMQKMPYDVARDLLPISLLSTQPNLLVVNPSLPVKSVKDLIALAKAKPGELNYGAAGTGGSSHLAAELFKSMAGVNFVRIPYKGSGQALNELMGGQVQLMFPSAPSVSSFLKSGKLRALAVTSAEPSMLFPSLPTIAASGVPGYDVGNASAMFAPMKTPQAIIMRLNQEVVRVLAKPDVKERFFNNSVEVVGSSPAQLAALVKSETAQLTKVIKDAGIKVE